MGYQAGAPVLGKDDYQAMPATPADARRARIAAQAFAVGGTPATATQAQAAAKAGTTPYLGQFDPLVDLKAGAASLPTYLQRSGTAHQAQAPSVAVERLSVAAACQYMRQQLGAQYDPGTYAWLAQKHGDAGVPRDVANGLIAARRQAFEPAPAPAALRVVAGGA
jgi:hypothetical protein